MYHEPKFKPGTIVYYPTPALHKIETQLVAAVHSGDNHINLYSFVEYPNGRIEESELFPTFHEALESLTQGTEPSND